MKRETIEATHRLFDALESGWNPGIQLPGGADAGSWSPDAETRRQVLEFLRNSVAKQDTGSGSDLKEENERLRQQLELSRTAYDYLVRLAHHFSGEEASFDSDDQIRAFCERIKRSVGILVAEFKELLSGRKKVQHDWSLYSSTAATGAGAVTDGTAFIRSADLHGDLGRHLFDWKSTDLDDDSSKGLRTAIDELKHHQLALMAGYERCVREGCLGVLNEMAPDSLDAEFINGTREAAPVEGFHWRKWIPWRTVLVWGLYRRRHEEVVSEDAQWFQSRFLPLFRQGYKEYMWAKMRGSTSEPPPSTGGA